MEVANRDHSVPPLLPDVRNHVLEFPIVAVNEEGPPASSWTKTTNYHRIDSFLISLPMLFLLSPEALALTVCMALLCIFSLEGGALRDQKNRKRDKALEGVRSTYVTHDKVTVGTSLRVK